MLIWSLELCEYLSPMSNPRERTPLHFASHNGHEKACKALLEAGSNVDSIDKRCSDGVLNNLTTH
jgi:hypothetical protein